MNPYQTEENRAYDAALRRFRESPRVQEALLGLKAAQIERQKQIRAFWCAFALGFMAGLAFLGVAILAMFAL